MPESLTAWVTIVCSTSSRSSVELTAWPTSFSACSSSTESRQLVAAGLELLEQVAVLDRDRRLGRQRRHQLDLPLRERVDLGADQPDDADHLPVAEHRHPEHRALAARPLALLPPIVGVDEDIGNVNRHALDRDLADQGADAGWIGLRASSAR